MEGFKSKIQKRNWKQKVKKREFTPKWDKKSEIDDKCPIYIKNVQQTLIKPTDLSKVQILLPSARAEAAPLIQLAEIEWDSASAYIPQRKWPTKAWMEVSKEMKGEVENKNPTIERVERIKMRPYAPEHRQSTWRAFYQGDLYNQEDLHEGEKSVCTRRVKTIKATMYFEYSESYIHPHQPFPYQSCKQQYLTIATTLWIDPRERRNQDLHQRVLTSPYPSQGKSLSLHQWETSLRRGKCGWAKDRALPSLNAPSIKIPSFFSVTA